MNNDIESPFVNKEDSDVYKKAFNDLEKKCDLKIDENALIKVLKNCNNNEEIQSFENMVQKFVNCKLEELPHYGLLKKLIDSKDEKSILEFFDFCVKSCIEEGKLDLMCEVTILLPKLIDTSFYKSPVGRLMKQLSYVKVPSKWCEIVEYQSINENFYGYKIHNPEPSKFDRSQKIPQHYSTLCYVPFPGLCSYPQDSSILNRLFPTKLSPFAKFIITYPDEIFQASNASSEIIDSPIFQAIVKFKWRNFARGRFFRIMGSYFIYFCFFIAAVATKWTSLQIISAIFGTFLTICVFRYAIIMLLNGAGGRFFSPTMFLTFSSIILPAVTGLAELATVESRWLITLRAASIGLLWIGIIESLVAFRRIGTFIIIVAHVARDVLWILIYVTLVMFASAHGTVVYSKDVLDYENSRNNNATLGDDLQKFQDLTEYKNSLTAYWSASFLSDYGSWPVNDIFLIIAKVAYSLFITVVILNLLIALVNTTYTDVLDRAYTEWCMVRAQMIVIIELSTFSPAERQNKDHFPWTIFYKVFTEDFDRWHQHLEERSIPVLRNQTQILDEMVSKMEDEIAKMNDYDTTKTNMMNKLNEFRQFLSK